MNSQTTAQSHSGASILVVDDDKIQLELLIEALTKYGYQVDAVSNGADALKHVSENKYDLVLLDLLMPGMDGFSVIVRLSEITTIPVLICSATDDPDDVARAFELGAIAFLDKPFNWPKIDGVIKSTLKNQKIISEMEERVKEQKCIYGVTAAIQRSLNPEDFLSEVASLIVSGVQYPEFARSKITLDDRDYIDGVFIPTEWKLSVDLVVVGEVRGSVELYYLKEFPMLDEGPFLEQERRLIDNVCVQLSEAITRYETNKKLNYYIEIVDKYVITSSTNTYGKITSASEAFCKISGYSKEELIGKSHNIVRHPDVPKSLYDDLWQTIKRGETWSGEILNRKKNQKSYWVEAHISPIFNDKNEITGYMAVRQDITNKKEIEKLSVTDRLTQIFNRMKVEQELERELGRTARYGCDLSIILLDIDHFKSINDSYGHDIGDKVLISIANLLSNNIREVDVLGRWGGEEFLIVCPETDAASAEKLAEKLRVAIENYEFPTVKSKTSSFGIATTKPGDTPIFLVKRADEALYKAKLNGRNRVESDQSL